MSRNIPPCRPWRVRYWLNNKIILEVRVNAVNADFAKYNASRIAPIPMLVACDRITALSLRGTA